MNEFNQLEHISVEHFRIPPYEARHIEVQPSKDYHLPDAEFVRQLLVHVSNEYEGRIIKPCDFLCFDFYGRCLTLEISKVHTFPHINLTEQMQSMNLNDEQFFHISSSTTWSMNNKFNKDEESYPISNIGGFYDIYEKIMNLVQKTKHSKF